MVIEADSGDGCFFDGQHRFQFQGFVVVAGDGGGHVVYARIGLNVVTVVYSGAVGQVAGDGQGFLRAVKGEGTVFKGDSGDGCRRDGERFVIFIKINRISIGLGPVLVNEDTVASHVFAGFTCYGRDDIG